MDNRRPSTGADLEMVSKHLEESGYSLESIRASAMESPEETIESLYQVSIAGNMNPSSEEGFGAWEVVHNVIEGNEGPPELLSHFDQRYVEASGEHVNYRKAGALSLLVAYLSLGNVGWAVKVRDRQEEKARRMHVKNRFLDHSP